ncbi:hypothetical protein [Campylobacter devanensis]|uniref:hypothetical protein n=1 Tax=Campylobacter devanensis TaxID=3161138 RepID=UPI00112FAF50|nr:hypothetical protein [Campylobacter sp. P0106]
MRICALSLLRFFIKTHKVNQKSEIFELLLFTTRYFVVACSLIGANLLPGIFSLRSKKPICICSHSLTRKAYNRSLRSLNAFLSHLVGKISVICVVVFDLLSIITTTTKTQKYAKNHKNAKLSILMGGGRVDMGKKVFLDFKGYFVMI